jgi:hypothetical protein
VIDRPAALRAERAAMLSFCGFLDEAEWCTASAAVGWRIQDVVAHLGGACHALFTPAALSLLRSSDIERSNDAMVDARRSWPQDKVFAEFERWSARAIGLSLITAALPVGRVRLPLAELGRFPAALLLGSALVFDLHTHLRFDMAPALGREAPPSDANRMAVVIEWMLAVLGNQLASATPEWMDRPLSLRLHGQGGDTWTIDRRGVANGASPAAVAVIDAAAERFPCWGTRRSPWRDHDIVISGDAAYGARFLDGINVV